MFGTPDTPKYLALLETLKNRSPTQGFERWSSPNHNHYISSRPTNFQKDRSKDKKMNDNKFIMANKKKDDGGDERDPDLEHTNSNDNSRNRGGRLTNFDEHTPSTTLLARIFSRSRPKPEILSWALLENQELPSIESIKASLFPNRDAFEEQVDQFSKLDQEDERRKKLLPAPLTVEEMKRRSELGMSNEDDDAKNNMNQSHDLQMLRRRLEAERLVRESELMTAKFRAEFAARKESFSHRREYRVEQAKEHEKIHQLETLKNLSRNGDSPSKYQNRFDTKASLALNHDEIDPIAAAAMKKSEAQEIGERYLGRKSLSLVDVAKTGKLSNLAIITKFVDDFSGASPDLVKRKVARRNSSEGDGEDDEEIEIDEDLENCEKEIEEAFSEQRSRFSQRKKTKLQKDENEQHSSESNPDEIDVAAKDESENIQDKLLVGKLTSDLILMLKQIQEQTYDFKNSSAESEKVLTSSRGRGEQIETQCLIDLIAAGFTNLSLHLVASSNSSSDSHISIPVQRNNDDDDEEFLIRFLQQAGSCFSDAAVIDRALVDEIYKTIISVESQKIIAKESYERKNTRDEQRAIFKSIATSRAKEYQILAASLFMKRLREEQERKEAQELAKKLREDEEQEKRRIDSETLVLDSARERKLIADSEQELDDIISSCTQAKKKPSSDSSGDEEQFFVVDQKNPKMNARLRAILEAVILSEEEGENNFALSPSRRNIGEWRKRQQEIDEAKCERARQDEKRERDELEILKVESEKVLNSRPRDKETDFSRSRSPSMDPERNLIWPSANKKLVGDSVVTRPLRRDLRASFDSATCDQIVNVASESDQRNCFVDNHHNRVRSRFELLRHLSQAERTRRELTIQDLSRVEEKDTDDRLFHGDHSFGILVPSQSAKRNVGGFMAAPSFFDKLIVDSATEYEKTLTEMKNANRDNENEKSRSTKTIIARNNLDVEEDEGEVSLRLTKGTHRSRMIEKIREEVVSKVVKERSSASANSVGVGTRFGRSI